MPHDVRLSAATSSAVVGERQLTPPPSSVASSSVKNSHLAELIDTSEDSGGVCDIQSLSLEAGKSVLRPQQGSSGKTAGNVNLLD
jgi:hypothetical protein